MGNITTVKSMILQEQPNYADLVQMIRQVNRVLKHFPDVYNYLVDVGLTQEGIIGLLKHLSVKIKKESQTEDIQLFNGYL